MEFFIWKIFNGKIDEKTHSHFVRFGRGNYKRRFLYSMKVGNKIKIKTSFEFANDLVEFASKNREIKFFGRILSKEKIGGIEGRKKNNIFIYDVSDFSINGLKNIYYYLLNAESSDMILKIKKSLPKPGKEADKIDDAFCFLEIDRKYWPALKENLFWDLPECKKAAVEHEIDISDIIIPSNEKDPAKIRELAKRKGKIKRKIIYDGKEINSERNFEA